VDSLGRYEIEKELGRGAMGVVYRGIDPKINRTVAMKCLHANLLEGDTGIGERFQQEMRALGRLVHPNIVTIFDAGEEPGSGQAYIVMEYVEGIPLSDIIKSKRSLTIDQIVHIGVQICRGLHFAHSKGVVHRDIKPGNILLSEDLMIVKIADFGIARLDNTALTQTDCLTGTPQYMSPEQCRGEDLDGRSDLFALGVLLYELLTKEKAFQGNSFSSIMLQILSDTPKSPYTISSHVPESVSDVVMHALEKKPDERFSSGNEMADALLKGIEKLSTPSPIMDDDDATRMVRPLDLPPQNDKKESSKQSKSSGSRSVILILVFLVIAGGLFFVLRESPKMTRPENPNIETEANKIDETDTKAEAGAKAKEIAKEKAEAEAKLKQVAKEKAEAAVKERALARAKAEAGAKAKEIVRAKAAAAADRLRIKKLSAGLLHFKTTPSGADILINGELKGTSPVSIELVGGKPYDLLIRKLGYHALEATIDVPVGETPMNLTLLKE